MYRLRKYTERWNINQERVMMFTSQVSPEEAIHQCETEIVENETKLRSAQQRRQSLLDGTAQPRPFSRKNPGQRETTEMAILEIDGYIANIELTLKQLHAQLAQMKKTDAASSFDIRKPFLDHTVFQSMEVIAEFADDAVIIANEHHHVITLVWQKFVQDEPYQDIMRTVLQAIQQQHASKLLIDARQYEILGQIDASWTKTCFSTEAYNAGLRYLALVLHDSDTIHTSVQMLDEQIHQEVPLHQPDSFFTLSFISLETALSWLLSREHHLLKAS
jgi:hypothetical protein